MHRELFSGEALAQALRSQGAITGVLHLDHLNIQPYQIPNSYTLEERVLGIGNPDSAIRTWIEPLAQLAESKGFNGNVYTAVYEALRNAHQHGNKGDGSKQIQLAYEFNPKRLNIIVTDQGGELDTQFIPFIQAVRSANSSLIDYYAFTGKRKPATNNGTGTAFMHTYVDKVTYGKSEAGGLLVHLTKQK